MPRKNKKLAIKVRDHILAEPLRLNMSSYIKRDEDGLFGGGWDSGRLGKYPSCGTAACIGGWAYLLGGRKKLSWMEDVPRTAMKYLGLTGAEADDLFTGGWYGSAKYKEAKVAKRAQMAAQKINELFGLEQGGGE